MTNEKMNFMELGMDDLEIVSGGTVREFDDLVYEFVQIPVLADLCGTAVGHVPGANNVAAYAVEPGSHTNGPVTEEKLTIFPYLASFIYGTAALHEFHTPK